MIVLFKTYPHKIDVLETSFLFHMHTWLLYL